METNKLNGLTREDLREYRSTNDEKVRNAIEKKSLNDDFDSAALEGWSNTTLTDLNLKRLDKKFAVKNYLRLYIAGAAILLITIVSLFLLQNNKDIGQSSVHFSQKPMDRKVERTDIILPEAIEKMKELPQSEQIKVLTVIREFEEQKVIQEQQPSKFEEQINELPVHSIESPRIPDKTVRETFFGKEIYLSDLKVLDYRAYRSKPSIQTKQLELTGTPADQSQPGSKQEDEWTWKTVDIPYMEYLEKSMEIFGRGNNKKALARFEEILKSYSDDINALFYSGLCYYNLNQFKKAAGSFEKCIDSKYTNFIEEAYWYLAKSLLADNEISRAKQILIDIRDACGYYSKQAEKLLK